MTLTINNETFASKDISSTIIEIESGFLSVSKIIEMKIRKEVEEYNKKSESGAATIEVTEFEKKLNSGKQAKSKKLTDINKQIEIGIEAFKNKEYFVIIDDRQIEDLDKVVEIKETTSISFLRLTPLIGG